jgi:hypothetical protein
MTAPTMKVPEVAATAQSKRRIGDAPLPFSIACPPVMRAVPQRIKRLDSKIHIA